jgi:3-hydroxybutyryl-CoA dehydrogenase
MARTWKTAAVIGTGMMGPGIAGALAIGGVETTILSREAARAEEALARCQSQLEMLEREEIVETAAARQGLRASSDLEAAVTGADLVVESAPENLAFKQELFARLDSLTRPDCVLASNTSGLSITAIARDCRRPERVLTTHFWNPPHLMPLVEIVLGEKTDRSLAADLKQLLELCGKVPVVVRKDTPGQLGNRLQMALYREALHIVQEGIADVEAVDLAAKAGFGLRLPVYGLFEHMDLVGLKMVSGIVDYVAKDLNREPGAPRSIFEKAERGETFHDWTRKDAAKVRALRDEFLREFLKAGWNRRAT